MPCIILPCIVNFASLPSFRRSIGEVLIEGTCSHLQLQVQAMVPTPSSIVRQHQDGHGIVYVYLLLVSSIVISPGPYIEQDEEEGIKEEEG